MRKRNVQVPNLTRTFRPSRQITRHSLFTPKAADISRSLCGNGASEVTSISASIGLRYQMRHEQCSPEFPKYICPVFSRDLETSRISISVKKTSIEFECRSCATTTTLHLKVEPFDAINIRSAA